MSPHFTPDWHFRLWHETDLPSGADNVRCSGYGKADLAHAGVDFRKMTRNRLRNCLHYLGQIRNDGIRLCVASIVRSRRPIDPNALHPECAYRCRFAAPLSYMDYPARMLADQLDGSVKNSGVGLVGFGLLRSDQHVKLHGKLFDCLREQSIVDIGNDGQSVTASKPS